MSVADYVFTWHALSDACPKCQVLNGYEFRGQDIYQSTVWHPIYGNVWQLDEGHTLAHPNCRCQLETRVVQVKVPEDVIRSLREVVEAARRLLEAL